MDRVTLEELLARFEQHVDGALRTVERQKLVVHHLGRHGSPPRLATATRLLFLFEDNLASVSAERDRLKREIAELPVEGSPG